MDFLCLPLFTLVICFQVIGFHCSSVERSQHKFRNTPNHSISKRSADSSDDPLKGRKIVCLFNSMNYFLTGYSPIMIEADNCTHVNYEFASLHPEKFELVPGHPDLDIEKGFFDETQTLKLMNPKLKVMISIGGWHDSTRKYSQLMESPERVDNFIQKVVEFLKKYQFDGLNVAWEYPNCWQGALGSNPADKNNFAGFLKKVREKFDENGYLLSISASAIKREIEAGYDGAAISSAVHHINVMTYDMYGPWDRKTGHHAQLDKKAEDEDQFLNMKSALEFWASHGADKLKLIGGIPFYAKTFTLENPENHAIGAPTKGPGRSSDGSKARDFICFNEICKLLNNGNWTEEEDKTYGFYAFFGDQWACYDPPTMVVKKAKWLTDNGFGGILLKDVSCDDFEGECRGMPNPLLRMGRMEMIHRLKKIH